MSLELDSKACGKIDHTGWLTTANRFLVLWTKKHDFEGENVDNLRKIVTWIVGSYFPMWFCMKIHHHWINGPNHLLHQIVLWREHPQLTLALTHDTIQREHIMDTVNMSYRHLSVALKRMIEGLQ